MNVLPLRTTPGIAWNSRGQHEHEYLLQFTVSKWSLLLMPVSFLGDRCILWLNNTASAAKVFEEVNRKCPVWNTTVLLSTPYLERHSSQRLRQTDNQL